MKQASVSLKDITLPGRNFRRGKVHPISHTISVIKRIFHSMHFQYIQGPDIDNEWNNFTALNISRDHPARQMHDTFYIKNFYDQQKFKNKRQALLLRTHTSAVQIRSMLKKGAPLKAFSIGKVYRSDSDATHTPMFHQLECLVIDKNCNILSLRAHLKIFLKLFFNTNKLPMRLRTSYFPFTEPSFEVDIKHNIINDRDSRINEEQKWLEILGCGMVRHEVFQNTRINSNLYQGFAFGAGIERLAMLKYNITDLRNFFENDIRWIQNYGF